jgi:hypothetical protein
VAVPESTLEYRRKENLKLEINKHLINRDRNLFTISEIVRLYINDTEGIKTMRRAVKVDSLPDGWKCHFLEQIK